MAQIKITLTKSPIGRIPSQRKNCCSTWTWQIEQLSYQRRQCCRSWYDYSCFSLGNC